MKKKIKNSMSRQEAKSQIPAGSWWAENKNCCGYAVLWVNPGTNDVTVLGTDGEMKIIDAIKLQHYNRVLPENINKEKHEIH